MSTVSYTLLTNQEALSYTGTAVRADAFYGNTDGLHTVSVHYTNFVGRVCIEGTVVTNPTESDWFPVYLTSGTSYRQYPVNSSQPTGTNSGDTGAEGFTFRGNLMYIRARVDRSYLPDTEYDSVNHGSIGKILLNV